MKKSEILAILGSSVMSYNVFKVDICTWLEVEVKWIDFAAISKLHESLLQIEPVNEYRIRLVFDSDTIMD